MNTHKIVFHKQINTHKMNKPDTKSMYVYNSQKQIAVNIQRTGIGFRMSSQQIFARVKQ